MVTFGPKLAFLRDNGKHGYVLSIVFILFKLCFRGLEYSISLIEKYTTVPDFSSENAYQGLVLTK